MDNLENIQRKVVTDNKCAKPTKEEEIDKKVKQVKANLRANLTLLKTDIAKLNEDYQDMQASLRDADEQQPKWAKVMDKNIFENLQKQLESLHVLVAEMGEELSSKTTEAEKLEQQLNEMETDKKLLIKKEAHQRHGK